MTGAPPSGALHATESRRADSWTQPGRSTTVPGTTSGDYSSIHQNSVRCEGSVTGSTPFRRCEVRSVIFSEQIGTS